MEELWKHFTAAFRRENYARFSGRATRAEYWSCMLFAFLFGCVPLILLAMGAAACIVSTVTGAVLLVAGAAAMLFYVFYTALPMLAVYVRRLHDAGSGWSGRWIALQYGIVAVMAVLELGIFLQFQLENEIDVFNIDPLSLAGDFEMFQPDWFHLCCRVADPAVSLLGLGLLVLTLLPSGPDNKYGPRA